MTNHRQPGAEDPGTNTALVVLVIVLVVVLIGVFFWWGRGDDDAEIEIDAPEEVSTMVQPTSSAGAAPSSSFRVVFRA